MFISRILFIWLVAIIASTIAAPVSKLRPVELNDDIDNYPELSARAPAPTGRPKLTVKHAGHAVIIKNKIDKAFAPERSKSVFWSGTVPHPTQHGHIVSVSDKAQQFAMDHHKKTLNHALHDAKIVIPEMHENPHVPHLWNHASAKWAHKSHGEVDAVLGSRVRPTGVYKKIEKPILMRNDQVTRVLEHNAHNGKVKQVKPAKACIGCVVT